MVGYSLATIVARNSHFSTKYRPILEETGFHVQTISLNDTIHLNTLNLPGKCFIFDNENGDFPFSHFFHHLQNHLINAVIIVMGAAPPPKGDEPYFLFSLSPDISTSNLRAILKNVFIFLQKNQRQNELASMILHDLRSPLNSLMGYLELILNGTFGSLNDGQKKILEKAIELGDSTMEMMEDLNEIFIGEQNSLYLEKKPFDLKQLLEQVLLHIWIKADRKNIKIRLEIPENLDSLYGDQYQIMRLLNNLLNNAIKYSNENSVIIIRARKQEKTIRVSVIDNGGGVNQKQLGRLFEKYYRGNPQNSRNRGYGLGLYISQLIIQAHGGKIWAENNSLGGLTVHFTLPVARKKNAPLPQSFY